MAFQFRAVAALSPLIMREFGIGIADLGLYNAALGMIFGFGPTMLAERGLSNSAASSITSVALWLVALSYPWAG
jgi:hypothetical protein